MEYTNNPIIKHKAGLLNLAEELGNVSRACKIMGVSRDTFYRYQELVEDGGLDALINKSRRQPNIKNRVDDATEQAVIVYAVEQPAHGQHRTSNELRKKGVFVSGSGVRSIWLRHDLENFKKRLKALEEKIANDGIILSDAQVAALEKKKHDDEACGEIETVHPGYLGSQDTFYVGNLKGVGRIYQQTFVDTYSKVAFAKLYTTKTPITAADMLNDKVLPYFEQYELPMLRILTDRGTEYCGRVDQHDYQLYWLSMILITPRQKRCHHRPMGSVSVFIKRFCRSFIKSRSGKSCMVRWKNYKKIWTSGWNTTTMTELIKEKCAVVEHHLKH
jgi:transposase|tara:strand:+ start:10336 stop:11328 length:993 start_codon:yes stop_codon:yes gene_type:complete